MAEVSTSWQGDILIFKVRGGYSSAEAHSWSDEIFGRLKPKELLMDFTEAHTEVVKADDVRALVLNAKAAMGESRAGRRTAWVAQEAGLFNLLCMYTVFSTLENTGTEHSVFHTREEALAWLQESEHGQPSSP